MKSRKRKRSKESKFKNENDDPNQDPKYVPSSQEEDTDCGPPIIKDTISNTVNTIISNPLIKKLFYC